MQLTFGSGQCPGRRKRLQTDPQLDCRPANRQETLSSEPLGCYSVLIGKKLTRQPIRPIV
jgi:hypothetical protein